MTMTPAHDKPGLSPGARQMIGIGALAVCLLIGAGIIWWFLFGSKPPGGEITLDPNARVNTRGRQMVVPRVTRTGGSDWAVRGDVGSMRVSGSGSDAKFAFAYQPGLLGLSPEQITLLSSRVRIISDKAMAKAWGITPEQVEKLKKLDAGGGGSTLKPTDAERNEINQLWQQYQSAADADKAAPQKKLVDRLDQIARPNLEVSKKVLAERYEQVRQILTPEQIAKITK